MIEYPLAMPGKPRGPSMIEGHLVTSSFNHEKSRVQCVCVRDTRRVLPINLPGPAAICTAARMTASGAGLSSQTAQPSLCLKMAGATNPGGGVLMPQRTSIGCTGALRHAASFHAASHAASLHAAHVRLCA